MEQRLEAGRLARHRHKGAYAAIVLQGGYLEAGSGGRFRVEAGDVVAHGPFDAHWNWVSDGTSVLNVSLRMMTDLPPVFRVSDPDILVRIARGTSSDAESLMTPVWMQSPLVEDWPDLLAAALRKDPRVCLGRWAKKHGLAPSTLSRGFGMAFGVTPARYRAEQRAHLAWRRLMRGGAEGMASLAVDCGYSDQAHFSRSVMALTGASPRTWQQINSIQDLEKRPI